MLFSGPRGALLRLDTMARRSGCHPLPSPPPEGVEVKRLDYLPLVSAMLQGLDVRETLEALIPPCAP
jgi:hypothetical protein